MSMPLKALLAGDPRRPDLVREYKPAPIDPEKEIPNGMLVLASLAGLMGMYLKMKWISWLTIFLVLSAFATGKTKDLDYKQLVMTSLFAVLGIVTAAVFPQSQFASAGLFSKAFSSRQSTGGESGMTPL